MEADRYRHLFDELVIFFMQRTDYGFARLGSEISTSTMPLGALAFVVRRYIRTARRVIESYALFLLIHETKEHQALLKLSPATIFMTTRTRGYHTGERTVAYQGLAVHILSERDPSTALVERPGGYGDLVVHSPDALYRLLSTLGVDPEPAVREWDKAARRRVRPS